MTTKATTITLPIDPETAEGDAAIRALLAAGLATPETICDAVPGLSLVEGCVVADDSPWHADDGNAEVTYDHCDSALEAAEKYVSEGEWGDDPDGSIEVRAWRVGIDADGEDCRVQEEAHDIDLVDVIDHAPLIRAAMGDAGCGTSPDDHDWTSEGEGGCDENPGVWSTGGTSMRYASHCRRCGLHRTERTTGSQRNPGEGDTVEYRALDDDEIAQMRAVGAMDDEPAGE